MIFLVLDKFKDFHLKNEDKFFLVLYMRGSYDSYNLKYFFAIISELN